MLRLKLKLRSKSVLRLRAAAGAGSGAGARHADLGGSTRRLKSRQTTRNDVLFGQIMRIKTWYLTSVRRELFACRLLMLLQKTYSPSYSIFKQNIVGINRWSSPVRQVAVDIHSKQIGFRRAKLKHTPGSAGAVVFDFILAKSLLLG